MNTKKTISEFLSSEYKEFAMYTIENRAIPSLVDSFKNSQRKIIHTSNEIWKTGNEKTLKVFQLSGKVAADCYYHHGNCLDSNTNILLKDGSFISIKDWLENYSNYKFEVVSYNEENKQFTTGIGHSPRIGSVTNIEYEIEMEDSSLIKCTENHPFLADRGWVCAKNLFETDNIVSINSYIKIKKIKKNILESPKVFYDITVDKYHNFVINKTSMIVTHNSSLENAIVNMAQKFKNNIPFLEEDGQFGSLRSPQASAARYIGTKLSPKFKLIYKDFDLLEYKYEEGDKIEPFYFLPIIPTILLNGISGIAVGFSNNILPRKVDDIIENCINSLANKKVKKMIPYIGAFNGEITIDEKNEKRWIISGIFKQVNKSTIRITELPPSYTYEKYEELLDKLVEEKIIISYEDNCKDNIDYIIKINNKIEFDTFKTLKLVEYSTENFTTLDENGKLKIFESDIEILKYFVKFRTNFYKKRKEKIMNKISNDLIIFSNKAKFIKAVLENKIIILNNKREEIFKEIEKNNINKIENSYDYLLKMPLYNLTKEIYDKLLKDLEIKKEDLSNIEKYNEVDMYIDDLKNLKKELKKIS